MGQVNGILSTSYLTPLVGGLTLPEDRTTVWLTVAPAGGHIGGQGQQWISTMATGPLDKAGQAFRRASGRALHIVEAWRSDDTQEFYFLDRYYKSPGNRVTGVNWNGYYWVKRAGVAAAAVPRTSNHGWGLSLDLGSTIDQGGTAYQQWKAAAEPHGWRNDVAGEPWHWTYYPALNTAGSSGATPFPDQEEDDMNADQDARLKNIESILAGEGTTSIRAELRETRDIAKNVEGIVDDARTSTQAVKDIVANLEYLLAKEVYDKLPGGIRDAVKDARARLANLEYITAKEGADGKGFRGTIDRIAKKLGA